VAQWDRLDKLFVFWAFLFQTILVVHFAVRERFFESYTVRYGWIVYALCIPAVIISIILLRGGKSWSFWLGGFLFVAFAAFGYWADYVAKIPFRSPLQVSVLLPYVFLYLATEMFYWWPLWPLSQSLWLAFGALYAMATVLNIASH